MQQPQYRPNHRAPPPPRQLDTSTDEPVDPERDIVKYEKKIRNTLIFIVIFVMMFIIIGILSVSVVENNYDGTLGSDENEYGFEFSVVSATDTCPVKIEVTSSHKVDYFFILTQENYDFYKDELDVEKRVNNYEQNAELTLEQSTRFTYEDDLPVGEYVIVSTLEERSYTVQLDYRISRYIIQPVLIFILLIFIILWVILTLRIYKLHQKKQELEQQEEYGAEYTGYYAGYGAPPPPPPSQYPPQQPYPQQPPPQPQTLEAPPTGRVYSTPEEPPQGPRIVGGPTPMPRVRRRPPPPDPSASYEPLVINCKCGGTIRVDSPERPIEIKCPDCGRKGMVEASESPGQSESDDYQYF